MLPGIDGFEVARRLRKRQNPTPILILTARDSVPNVVKGPDSGADDRHETSVHLVLRFQSPDSVLLQHWALDPQSSTV